LSEIRTFPDFLKRLIIVLGGLLILAIIIFGVLIYTIPAISNFNGILLESLSNPIVMLNYLDSLGVGINSLFFKIVVFPGYTWAAIIATEIIWFERKFLAKMQVRVGPLYAGMIGGILQPIADVSKLIFKELISPSRSDKLIFFTIPLLVNAIGATLLAVLPVSEGWLIMRSEVSMLIVFAVIGFAPITVLLAGWASYSKFPFIGGLRGLHQMIAFEIPMLIAALSVVLLSGSLDLVNIVQAQSNVWFIVLMPIGAIVFFITLLAELERIPFDLPEAESEIVMGYLTEYSSMAFGGIQLGTYIRFYALSGIFTTLFLGGWHGPQFLPAGFEIINQIEWFTIKTLLVMVTIIILRGVNPRFRIDQLLRFSWSRLLILAFLNLFIAIFILQMGWFPFGGGI
jgi:NADH-quinone oxidoreductase subunit H|tara:strand:+ start:7361 stop:8557 length:1197 start_codon:yes stop_codon:yes gene_type:complete